MKKLILIYWESREEYDSAEIILPFNYESADLARADLTKIVTEYAENWINYYRKQIGSPYPKNNIKFAGHPLNLNNIINYNTNGLLPGVFQVQTLDEWWKENCKN
jgi:hypothetical protein